MEFRGNRKKPAIAGFKNKTIFHPQSLPAENAGNKKRSGDKIKYRVLKGKSRQR